MLLSELNELEDILELIEPEEKEEKEEPFCFNEEEQCEIIESLIQLMTDYIDENPCEVSEPDFHEAMIESVQELYSPMIVPEMYNTSCVNLSMDLVHDCLDELIEIASDLFYNQIIPPRSFPTTFVKELKNTEKIAFLQEKIDYLGNKPQPQQRTEEWYEFRHNLITASNAYKAFENQNTQNQLIYEKCQSLSSQGDKFSFVNVETTFHWGQKYEPISVMYYEAEYNTRVGDFGCIQHDKYKFLGASPDGINNDPSRPLRFGRMLEIKNIVNRDIDGIPKKEYWIQMQLQMETCDLDECDFLETRFNEYECETDFLDDGENFTTTKKGDLKGIIMYFSTKEGRPHYVYKPLAMDKEEYEQWFEENMTALSETMCWIKNIYWRLDEVSCVLVLRNKTWFQRNICQLENIWKTIERERITGEFSSRAPNKRVKKTTEQDAQVLQVNKIEMYFDVGVNYEVVKKTDCLIPLPNVSTSTTVIKIRTESFDETKKQMQ